MSSIQDRFLGLMERENGNLNWSATCSYYALVHGGRLLSFLALGDFPMSHSVLKAVLGCRRASNPQKKILDWLVHITKQTIDYGKRDPFELNQLLLGYFELHGVEHFDARFRQFAEILRIAADLRNDSNYEALLIAHEHEHGFMTHVFARLASAMSRATEVALPLITEAFSAYVDNDAELDQKRPAYRNFWHHELYKRVLPAVAAKLQGHPRLREDLERLAREIQPQAPAPSRWYDDLDQMVSMELFNPKRGLMEKFESGISLLEQEVDDR
jgi:hypothetical protein